jgi:hypothetical protein
MSPTRTRTRTRYKRKPLWALELGQRERERAKREIQQTVSLRGGWLWIPVLLCALAAIWALISLIRP